MSKYLCQDCKSNNNGWCTVRRCNGLKKLNITSCNTYENKGDKPIEIANQPTFPRPKKPMVVKRAEPLVFDNKDDDSEAYRVLGKRQMLWNIQCQIVAINKDDDLNYEEKYKELVSSIKSLGEHLEFEEKLWKVDDIIDSMIDEAMVKDSKYMNKML